jgi:hypothetical protein
MELDQRISNIKSRQDLAEFVGALRQDLETNDNGCENPTLEQFLGAMEAWIQSMDAFYRNRGEQPPASPSWQTFAHILYASRIRE